MRPNCGLHSCLCDSSHLTFAKIYKLFLQKDFTHMLGFSALKIGAQKTFFSEIDRTGIATSAGSSILLFHWTNTKTISTLLNRGQMSQKDVHLPAFIYRGCVDDTFFTDGTNHSAPRWVPFCHDLFRWFLVVVVPLLNAAFHSLVH